MTDRELMQMSLKELEKLCQTFSYPPDSLYDTINALRARLAQPEPEPVAWMYEFGTDCGDAVHGIRWYSNVHWEKPSGLVRNVVPLYTAPPQREWQNAALRIGEELSSVGPDGYYAMSSSEWLDWALAQNPKGKTSLQQREWQGMTDEELVPIYAEYKSPRNIYLAIESALRNKNT